jgi:hypothetical protein
MRLATWIGIIAALVGVVVAEGRDDSIRPAESDGFTVLDDCAGSGVGCARIVYRSHPSEGGDSGGGEN